MDVWRGPLSLRLSTVVSVSISPSSSGCPPALNIFPWQLYSYTGLGTLPARTHTHTT
jgi:hypothetical protein